MREHGTNKEQCSSISPLFGCQADAWTWVLVEGLVHKHGFNATLDSVAWPNVEGRSGVHGGMKAGWEVCGGALRYTGPVEVWDGVWLDWMPMRERSGA